MNSIVTISELLTLQKMRKALEDKETHSVVQPRSMPMHTMCSSLAVVLTMQSAWKAV